MAEADEQARTQDQDERPRRRAGQSWESYIDEQIRAAQERGEFDQLTGSGQPLHLDVNPFAGDRALAFSLLKGQGVAPQEIDLGREIDRERQRAERLITELTQRRDALRRRHVGPFASERRAYNTRVVRTLSDVEATLRASNSKALSLNIIAPTPLHRPLLDIEQHMAALRDEFPLLPG